MSEQEHQELDQQTQEDLLQALLEAADTGQQTATVEVARKGKVLFRFKVRALTEREVQECGNFATTWGRHKASGLRVREEFDESRFNAAMIHRATVEEDRARLWDDKEIQRHLGVLSGVDVIEKVLLAGEKSGAVDVIERLSGYQATGKLVDAAKN